MQLIACKQCKKFSDQENRKSKLGIVTILTA